MTAAEQAAQQAAGGRFVRIALVGLAVLGVLALGLWSRYGSAVFLETMATAWAYCF